MANTFVQWPTPGSSGGSGSNASVGLTNITAPASATEVGFIDGSGNLQPLTGTVANGPIVNVSNSALPTGAATSALQTTGNTSAATIATNTGTIATNTNVGTNGAATSALQTSGNSSLASILANQTNNTQTVADDGPVTPGTVASKSSLAGLQYNSTAPAPTTGQQVALQGDQFANLLSISPDQLLTGQSAQTATINNILPATASANATAGANYRSASVQVVSTGTAGTFIFEGSNDNVNFSPLTVYNAFALTGTPINAAITATASAIVYVFPITNTFIRLRIASTITGGSIQAFSKLSSMPLNLPVVQIAQATAANLNATVAGNLTTVATVTTVGTVTAANLAAPSSIADVTSAAITTTATAGPFTPTFGTSYIVNIPVTVVSGTTPSMSVAVQESLDGGTNYSTVYTFPAITATGTYSSPVLTLKGNRVQYVQTITGTTPSFTRSINRLQSSQPNINQPQGTVFTDRSGNTSGTPSTSTQLAASNPNRRYFAIQNPPTNTVPIYFNFTSAATAGSGSFSLNPGGTYTMENGTISTEAINVLATVASIAFTAKEG